MAVLVRDLGLLFIGVPRTGCTSISRFLVDEFGGIFVPREDILDADGRILVSRKHSSLEDIRRHELIPPETLHRLRTCAAVRNPSGESVPDSLAHTIATEIKNRAGCRSEVTVELIPSQTYSTFETGGPA